MNVLTNNVNVPNRENCLVELKNITVITNVYQGIPQTLILNIIAWVFLVILFIIFRRNAWDYGRLGLSNNLNKKLRWTQLFYASGDDEHNINDDDDNNDETTTSTRVRSPKTRRSLSTITQSTTQLTTLTTTDGCENYNNNQQTTQNQTNLIDRGYFSWIWITLQLKKEQIQDHSGPDAVHYLSFQKHLMCVMSVITLVSIIVILPVNFLGKLVSDNNSFGHTTVSNLEPGSPYLWIHVFVAICFVPLIVLVMRRASGRNARKKAPTKTIMITNICKTDCTQTSILTNIQQLFPNITITDIQFCYNVKKLTNAMNEYERIFEARMYCERNNNKKKKPITVRNLVTCKKENASDYYQRKERTLHNEVIELREKSLNDSLGIAFITVSTTQEAQTIIHNFHENSYRKWKLKFAPAPSDLLWENLTIDTGQWHLKWIAVNFILFVLLFFLTTPVIVVNLLRTFKITKNVLFGPVFSDFLPTLLLWTLAAVMPAIVSVSEKYLPHRTKSKQNYAIMVKAFSYLLLMILILPSLGLTSAQALIEWTLYYSETSKYRWECIFLPDKGAFFVNYVITAAFIGTALELIRLPELIVYTWQICTARSRAEHPYIRKSILIEFPFGIHYAWTIMVFTMSTVYSLACPLIMPFAMVYILMKHFVDRYNLYFAYGPSNMISQGGGKIHFTAVTMTKVSVIMLLIIMAALASVRGGGLDARAIVLIVSLSLTLIIFSFMSPIKKCTSKPPTITNSDTITPIYIASVLNKRIVERLITEA